MSQMISLKAEKVQIQEAWEPNLLFWLKNVYLIYKAKYFETIALKEVNLKIWKGEYLAILGPSGSGKTSFLKVLAGILPITTGRIYFRNTAGDIENLDRYDLDQRTEYRRDLIGYIPQESILFENLTVEENIKAPLIIKNLHIEAIDEHVEKILKLCKIEHRRNFALDQISGGEKQRLQIAMALVSSPQILIADEPTANLDSENAIYLFALLKDLSIALKQTIIVVTHDERINQYCNRSLHINDGAIT